MSSEKQYEKDTNLFNKIDKFKTDIENITEKARAQLKIDLPIGTNLMIRLSGRIARATVSEFPDYWSLSDRLFFCVVYVSTGKIKKIKGYDVVCKCDKNWNQIFTGRGS